MSLHITLPGRINHTTNKRQAHFNLVRVPAAGNDAFINVISLVRDIAAAGREYIICGESRCTLEHHTRPSSLDYWLRRRFPAYRDTLLADKDVIRDLVATGYFRAVARLRCPDDGKLGRGLLLTEVGRALAGK